MPNETNDFDGADHPGMMGELVETLRAIDPCLIKLLLSGDL